MLQQRMTTTLPTGAMRRCLSLSTSGPSWNPWPEKLTDAEIDEWFVDLDKANEGRGFNLELTSDGELVINPMVNRDGTKAETRLTSSLEIWEEEYGGEAHGANANMRLPDGSRIRPDALWLSPEQVASMPPVSAGGAITVCPAFVAEIMSGTDRLPPLPAQDGTVHRQRRAAGLAD